MYVRNKKEPKYLRKKAVRTTTTLLLETLIISLQCRLMGKSCIETVNKRMDTKGERGWI